MAAPRSNIKRDCPHGGKHKHGTLTAYNRDDCRCGECADFVSRMDAERRKLQAYGRWQSPFVDAEPARQHVRALMAQGMGWERVAEVSGVSKSTVNALLYSRVERPPSSKLRRDNAAALLATTINRAPRRGIDPSGTHRRLQALIVAGYSMASLCRHLGVTSDRVRQLLAAQRVSTMMAERVTVLFNELWDAPPPSATPGDKHSITTALNLARRYGFAPALAWDDDTIDDPAAVPYTAPARPLFDEMVVTLVLAGRRPLPTGKWNPDRVEVLRRLHAQGLTVGEIAYRVNVSTDGVRRALARIPTDQEAAA